MSTDSLTDDTTETGAEDVAWDLESLLDGDDVDSLVARALDDARSLTADAKGTIAERDAAGLATLLERLAAIYETAHRAGNYTQLRFSTATSDPERGAQMQRVSEQLSTLSAELVWFDLEWVAVDDDRAESLLDDDALAPFRHHLETVRAGKPHVLSEVEERLLANTAPTGRSAWVRLFTEQTSAIEVDLPTSGGTDTVSLDAALARLHHPDRDKRRTAAEAVTAGLQPGLRTRAYVFNTLLADRRIK